MSSRSSSFAPEQVRGFRRWAFRLRLVVVVCFFGLASLWPLGTLDWVLCRRIESLVAARHYEEAEPLITWLRWSGSTRAELSFWEGRLLRKQSRSEEALKCLETARTAGYDKERVRRELILLHAQAGNLSPVRREFEAMLASPGPDASEICEAFVNGA